MRPAPSPRADDGGVPPDRDRRGLGTIDGRLLLGGPVLPDKRRPPATTATRGCSRDDDDDDGHHPIVSSAASECSIETEYSRYSNDDDGRMVRDDDDDDDEREEEVPRQDHRDEEVDDESCSVATEPRRHPRHPRRDRPSSSIIIGETRDDDDEEDISIRTEEDASGTTTTTGSNVSSSKRRSIGRFEKRPVVAVAVAVAEKFVGEEEQREEGTVFRRQKTEEFRSPPPGSMGPSSSGRPPRSTIANARTAATDKNTAQRGKWEKMMKKKKKKEEGIATNSPLVVAKKTAAENSRCSVVGPVSSSPPDDDDIDDDIEWTGRIVGLRLPANVDPEFDIKSKPPRDRRVNPAEFLAIVVVVDDDEKGKAKKKTTTTTTAIPREEEGGAVRSVMGPAAVERSNCGERWYRRRKDQAYDEDGEYDEDDHDTANIALDICLSAKRRRGRGGVGDCYYPSTTTTTTTTTTADEAVDVGRMRMIRGPDEVASRTLERLRLSVQKKVGGGGGGGRRTTTTRRRRKATKKAGDRKGDKKKGAAEEEAGGDDVDERDDERVVTRLLWKARKIREGDDDASSSPDATRQRPTSSSTSSSSSSSGEDDDVMAAATCIAFWDAFSDFVLPIDPCNPWNTAAIIGGEKYRNPFSAGEKSATTRAADRSDAAADDDDDIGGIIAGGGCEVADDIDANSLTIDELLRRAMTDAKVGSYALSVPVSFDDDRTTSPIHVTIESCPPTITSVSTFGSFVESHLFANTPVVVEVGLLYSTCVVITWFADREQVFADGPCYTPTENDVDKVLTVIIVPRRHDHDGGGCEEAYQFKRRVEALPPLPIVRPLREGFMNRPSHESRPPRQRRHHRRDDTTIREDDPTMSLRVVTYNILADQYSSRDVDKKDDADRMYSHCKYEYLTKWRRHPLIVHEILAYRPDVVALQEVDADVFAHLLKPVLTAKGYEGYFSPKGGDANPGVGEGCAIFWSLEVFDSVRPVDMRTRTFREMFQEFSCEEHNNTHTSQWKSLKDMSELLDKHRELKHVLFNKLGHIMQTVVLTQRQSQEKLVIGNTHLFYHPMASHIRCLKMLIASRQLEIEHRENQCCPIILCGDLNSHPQSGVMKLLLDRYLNANNGQTWKHLCTFEWEEGQGAGVRRDAEAIDLELPPSFPKFLSGYPTPPDFTHYIEAFICTLDYILVTNNFEVEKAGATPTRDGVRKFTAMPNECMPSDHVSLVCDLVWR